MTYGLFGLSLLITLVAVSSTSTRAIEIESCPNFVVEQSMEQKSCNNELWLSGEFVRGDYDKFRAALADLPEPIWSVNLFNSPGGNMEEAMKIGRLIRKLRLQTVIAIHEQKRFTLSSATIHDNDVVCASACVFVFMAGAERFGWIGLIVHRPYFDKSNFSNLTLSEAEAHYATLEAIAYGYLREMNSPESLVDKMKQVPSSEGERLKALYVRRELNGMTRGYDEWLTSKCGNNPDDLMDAWEQAASKPPELRTDEEDRLVEEQDGILTCRVMASKSERDEAWRIEFRSN